jgi:hypothetical protein
MITFLVIPKEIGHVGINILYGPFGEFNYRKEIDRDTG